MANATIFTNEQEQQLKEAVKAQKNIAVIGMMASGKTTTYKELLRIISETDTAPEAYSAIDEVAGEAAQNYVNMTLENGRKVLFTHHASDVDKIKVLFPQFTGIVVKTSCDKGDFHVAVE